jgi:hypothetical protein
LIHLAIAYRSGALIVRTIDVDDDALMHVQTTLLDATEYACNQYVACCPVVCQRRLFDQPEDATFWHRDFFANRMFDVSDQIHVPVLPNTQMYNAHALVMCTNQQRAARPATRTSTNTSGVTQDLWFRYIRLPVDAKLFAAESLHAELFRGIDEHIAETREALRQYLITNPPPAHLPRRSPSPTNGDPPPEIPPRRSLSPTNGDPPPGIPPDDDDDEDDGHTIEPYFDAVRRDIADTVGVRVRLDAQAGFASLHASAVMDVERGPGMDGIRKQVNDDVFLTVDQIMTRMRVHLMTRVNESLVAAGIPAVYIHPALPGATVGVCYKHVARACNIYLNRKFRDQSTWSTSVNRRRAAVAASFDVLSQRALMSDAALVALREAHVVILQDFIARVT